MVHHNGKGIVLRFMACLIVGAVLLSVIGGVLRHWIFVISAMALIVFVVLLARLIRRSGNKPVRRMGWRWCESRGSQFHMFTAFIARLVEIAFMFLLALIELLELALVAIFSLWGKR